MKLQEYIFSALFMLFLVVALYGAKREADKRSAYNARTQEIYYQLVWDEQQLEVANGMFGMWDNDSETMVTR